MALITGGASGLGECTAKPFASVHVLEARGGGIDEERRGEVGQARGGDAADD